QIAEEGLTEELARATLPSFYGPAFMARDPESLGFHIDRELGMKREAITEGLRVLADRDSVVDRLSAIAVPTLVIHGEVDAAIPIVHAETTASKIAGATLVRIPDCGHTAPIEAPDAVNAALASFLR